MNEAPVSLVELCHGDAASRAAAAPAIPQLTVAVRGDSMRPSLAPGDRVVVLPCGLDDLTPGDIVLVDGPTPLLHRYLYRTTAGCVSKGDASRATDHPWSPRQLVGRVPVRLRGARGTRLDRGLRGLRGRLQARYWWLRHRVAGMLRPRY